MVGIASRVGTVVIKKNKAPSTYFENHCVRKNKKEGAGMPAQQRYKTDYPGVTYIIGKSIATGKPEKIYYIDYRQGGKRIQEKAGRQVEEGMTPARAALLRADKISGKQLSNAEKRASVVAEKEAEKAAKEAEENRWTIAKLWDSYCDAFPHNKGIVSEKKKFDAHIRTVIGDKEPSGLLPLDVDRIRLKLQRKGHKTTSARVLELLRRTLNHGVKRGLIAALPFKIEIPRLNNQTTEDLSENQLGMLLDVLDKDKDQQAANVMRLALFTGMRRTEIFRLKWTDIDKERGFIFIRDPKGGTDQKIPLNGSVAAIFETIEPAEDNPYVFPGQKKETHLTTLHRKSVDRIRKAAGFPPGFRPLHGLRHVYASMLASSGQVDLYTLQKLLTHKSPAMTQRYAHLRDEPLKKAANVAADIVSRIVRSAGGKIVEIDKKVQ